LVSQIYGLIIFSISIRTANQVIFESHPVNVNKLPPNLKLLWLLQVIHRVTVFHSIFDIPCSTNHPVNVAKCPQNLKLLWLLQVIHRVISWRHRFNLMMLSLAAQNTGFSVCE
jgi:hypothetical protein